MSAEPARRPEDEEVTQPDAPAPDEVLPPTADDPVPNPEASLTPEAAASAEAAAAAEATPADGSSLTTDTPADPVASEAAVVTADAQAADTTAEALATIDAASDPAAAEAKAAEDAKAAADAKAERRMARRRTVGGAIKAILTVVIAVVLLVGGIAIGSYVFQATRPAPTLQAPASRRRSSAVTRTGEVDSDFHRGRRSAARPILVR